MIICAMARQILSQFSRVTCLFNKLKALVASTSIIASVSSAAKSCLRYMPSELRDQPRRCKTSLPMLR